MRGCDKKGGESTLGCKLSDGAHMVHLLLRELSVGRGSTATFGGGSMPKIHTVEAWDGKDGQVSGSIKVVS